MKWPKVYALDLCLLANRRSSLPSGVVNCLILCSIRGRHRASNNARHRIRDLANARAEQSPLVDFLARPQLQRIRADPILSICHRGPLGAAHPK
jgi:hypothetical protein